MPGLVLFCSALWSGRWETERKQQQEKDRQWLEEEKRRVETDKKAREAAELAERTRVWTDTTGTYSITATFIGYASGKAKLRKEDGSEVDVGIERLSEDDKQFLRERFRQRRMRPPF